MQSALPLISPGWISADPGRTALRRLLTLSEDQVGFLVDHVRRPLSRPETIAEFTGRFPEFSQAEAFDVLSLIDVLGERAAARGVDAQRVTDELSDASPALDLAALSSQNRELIGGLFGALMASGAGLRQVAISAAMPVLQSLKLHCDLRVVEGGSRPVRFALVFLARLEADEEISGQDSIVLQVEEEMLGSMADTIRDAQAVAAAARAMLKDLIL